MPNESPRPTLQLCLFWNKLLYLFPVFLLVFVIYGFKGVKLFFWILKISVLNVVSVAEITFRANKFVNKCFLWGIISYIIIFFLHFTHFWKRIKWARFFIILLTFPLISQLYFLRFLHIGSLLPIYLLPRTLLHHFFLYTFNILFPTLHIFFIWFSEIYLASDDVSWDVVFNRIEIFLNAFIFILYRIHSF